MANISDLQSEYVLLGKKGNILKDRFKKNKYRFCALKELNIDISMHNQEELFLNLIEILKKPINSSVLPFIGFSTQNNLNSEIKHHPVLIFEQVKENMKFTKPFKFPFKFECSANDPCYCNNYINIRIMKNGIFDFSYRTQINQKRELSLEQLFRNHIQQSQLEPGCKFTCDFCGKKFRSFQRIKYTKIPKILICHINRSNIFMFSHPNESEISLPHSLSIGINNEFNSIKVDQNNDNENEYELKAISHHSGSFDFGHYWSNSKRGGNWFDLNDSFVNLFSEEPNGATGSCHVVFYQQLK